MITDSDETWGDNILSTASVRNCHAYRTIAKRLSRRQFLPVDRLNLSFSEVRLSSVSIFRSHEVNVQVFTITARYA